MTIHANRLLFLGCRYIDTLLANADPERLSLSSTERFMRSASDRLGYTRAVWREALARHAPLLPPEARASDGSGDDDEDIENYLDPRRDPAQVVALARRFLQQTMQAHRTRKRAAPERVADEFAHALTLDDVERALLNFLVVRAFDPTMNGFFSTFSGYGISVEQQLSLACSLPVDSVARAISPHGVLATQGLIEPYGFEACLATDFMKIVERAVRRNLPVTQALVGRCAKSALDARDIAWMREDVDDLVAILQAALARNAHGINILLHGDPGVGKTELAKLLGARAGGSVFLAGESNEDGHAAVSSLERLQQLQFANLLLDRRPGAVLLFDEAEDVFFGSWSDAARPSKVQINRLLEENRVPTLWTSNRIHAMDEAHLRRFSAIVHMKAAPVAVRREQIARQARRKGVRLSNATLDTLSRVQGVSPGIIDSASRVANLVGGDESQFTRTVNRLVTAAGGAPLDAPQPGAGGRFDAALCNADTDLAQLTQRLVNAARRRYSQLLHGAPGTGKTLYTRELAGRLGMELQVVRASDLLGPYLGQTERAIADAFREAVAAGSFLVIDEADSLLQQRSRAQRSWEVTQVNELLTWMEQHPLPFAFTTNFIDALDAASMRRFTFKIGFGFLTPAQARLAFAQYFGQTAPAALDALARLTPGDFAVVASKAALLGVTAAAELLPMLAGECALKEGPARRIGFV